MQYQESLTFSVRVPFRVTVRALTGRKPQPRKILHKTRWITSQAWQRPEVSILQPPPIRQALHSFAWRCPYENLPGGFERFSHAKSLEYPPKRKLARPRSFRKPRLRLLTCIWTVQPSCLKSLIERLQFWPATAVEMTPLILCPERRYYGLEANSTRSSQFDEGNSRESNGSVF